MAVWSTVGIAAVLETDRFDGDYFKPDDLGSIRKIADKGGIELGSIADILTGRTPSDYNDAGSLAVVRSGDLVAPLIYPTCDRPFLKAQPSRDRVQLRQGDILISSIGMGSIGKISLVVDPTDLITVSEVTVLRNARVPPEFLFAYLTSSTGQSQIEREVTGATGQQHLLKSKVARILVPAPPDGIEPVLRKAIYEAYQRQEDGRIAYAEAEMLLESALGLDKVDLTSQLFYERPYADVQTAARLDPEYFQPKYVALKRRLRETGSAIRLGDHIKEQLRRGVQPVYDEAGSIPVINSQHVGKTTIDLSDCRATTDVLASSKAKVGQYDILLNSTGYVTIGRCQALLENIEAVVDGHVTIIRPTDTLDPVYLATFLNSRAGQLQTEQAWSGSSGQIELRLEAIADFLVWNAPRDIQETVCRKIEDAFDARREARRLLDEAKAMVERAIFGEKSS